MKGVQSVQSVLTALASEAGELDEGGISRHDHRLRELYYVIREDRGGRMSCGKAGSVVVFEAGGSGEAGEGSIFATIRAACEIPKFCFSRFHLGRLGCEGGSVCSVCA